MIYKALQNALCIKHVAFRCNISSSPIWML